MPRASLGHHSTEEIAMIVQNYLTFDGRCEEALEFYKRTLGAEVLMLMRFKDAPQDQQCNLSPGSENKVMHACFRIGETQIMASDGRNRGQTDFKGFCLSLQVDTEAQASKAFNALADGGQVTMPLSSTFFAKSFGMVDDRFGVHWMVIVPAEQGAQAGKAKEKVSA
jgi:PhnB protein